MFTQEVNVEAMYRATTLLFGDQASMILAKLADVIDKAMVDGYELGLQEGRAGLEAACDASFDAGWQFGEAEGALEAAAGDEEEQAEAYDDGYLQGVQDARANPTLADETVQEIISLRAEEHFEAVIDIESDGYRTFAG
jgi:hypothetical protein